MDELRRPYHPLANLFPLMDGDEYARFKADIAANGLREPIWITADGQIIDGRNRHRACIETDTPMQFKTWDGCGSLVAFVVSLNLHRRHLTTSQCAVIALDILPMLEAEARERQGSRNDLTSVKELTEVEAPQRATEEAARITGTNRQYVSDAKKLSQAAPDLLADVRAGDKTITEAKRELKERAREQVREQNRTLVEQVAPLPVAESLRYQTIVLDPPWDWGDEGDCDQYGRARPTYATMPLEEIAALPVGELAQPNAHLYLWITNRSLPKGFELIGRWGFRYVTALTWVKPSFGMGNYFRGSTEHVLFAVRGSLPLLRHDLATHFAAPRPGMHSGKPDAFYQLVESASPGPWLEMFSRQPRNGWYAWGAEAHGSYQ